MSADRKVLALELYDAVAKFDWSRIEPILTDDAVWRTPTWAVDRGLYAGKEAIRDRFFGAASSMFTPEGIDITVTTVVGDGNVVCLELISKATTAHGASYDNLYAIVLEFGSDHHDGVRDDSMKVRAVRTYCDTAHVDEVFAEGQRLQ